MIRLVVGALLAAVLLAGCQDKKPEPPKPVPLTLAPKSVVGGSLAFHLNTAPGTQAAFRDVGKDSLIDAGQLWEIRRRDRLVGTLQISTVKSDVNLGKRSVRDQFTAPILVGARSDIRLSGQEVDVVDNESGLSTLVWFGKGLFLVLQVKDKLVSGPELAQQVIDYQQSRPEWEPLPQLYTPT